MNAVGMCLAPWMVAGVMTTGLFLSMPVEAIAQQQLNTYSPEQQAALKEAQELNQEALKLYREGKYNTAIPLMERLLVIVEKVLGKEHPDVATSLNNLAEIYRTQGKYEQAQPLYLRSLAIYEKILGKEHPYVATILNNLALLYYLQGNYQQAEQYHLRSLAIREKALGKEHPDIAQSLNNLAQLYRVQGNYQQAVPLSVRSLAILEKVLGKEHPDVATSLNNLSILYFLQGNYQQAEQIYLRSLAIREKILGKEHPDVAQSLNNLAELYRVQGNYQQAQRFYLRSLNILEKFLGKEHPDVATNLNNLALLYHSQGNYQQAEQLYLRSLVIIEKVLGKKHPDVARNLDNLTGLYWAKGDITRAIDFLRCGLEVEEQNLNLIFAVGSEQRKQTYVKTFSTTTDRTISLSLQEARAQKTAASLALTTVLRRKGLVLDAVADSIQISKVSGSRGSQNRRSGDLANLEFPPLDNTKYEAAAIKKVLPNAKVLLGKDATETAVKQLQSPSILHLATHGFFIADIEQNLNASPDLDLTPRQPKILQVENPLLRSGLALAGFNQRKQATNNHDDGVLTALEVAGLDLRSNQLVVLSACETGRGDIKVGDGVYGLRRALVIAGSQSQVLSLWLVDDAATKDLMVKYYQNLQALKGRHEALRAAQLEMLKSEKYEHPQFWAAFVPSGNWTPLSEK